LTEPIVLRAAADAAAARLDHYWSRVGAGRANEGLRADWRGIWPGAFSDPGPRPIRWSEQATPGRPRAKHRA
jgi:hypothetical protein